MTFPKESTSEGRSHLLCCFRLPDKWRHQMAVGGTLGEGMGNQGFWRADLVLSLVSIPTSHGCNPDHVPRESKILVDCESWWPDKMRNLVWVLRLIVIIVIHVPDLTTNVQWTLHGSTAIMCVIRCQVNFVEKAVINWMDFLTMSYHHLIFSLSSSILRSFQLHCLETAVKCPGKFLSSFPQEV